MSKFIIKKDNGDILKTWGEDGKSPVFEANPENPYIYEDDEENYSFALDNVELDVIWLKENKNIKAHGEAIGENIFVLD